ncbi:MAG: PhzF family phenazine biosynthesis protein [Ruminococcaceae bacterium]|jgi:PhzF family phenazine biosynthesis protein|nr:PhzF family phenazine biosynthesis protein [Oscillospiraceae bacterium]
MEAYVMDAFSARIFGGNQAGVVLPDRPLEDALMQQIAAEFKHSETAFVTVNEDGSVSLKYFTPAGEVDLCGHATIASFALLRDLGRIGDGERTAHTRSGDLAIGVQGDTVWMDMAPPRLLRTLPEEEWAPLYEAYGLSPADRPAGYVPKLVSTGLADIMLPVKNHEILMAAVQDERAVTELSRHYECVGVHMFCPGGSDCTAYCSNYAPLYDIPEECATGTSNGALTYYLYLRGDVAPGAENVFLQGEHMGRPSEIRSRLTASGEEVLVRVGGRAVMSMRCELQL